MINALIMNKIFEKSKENIGFDESKDYIICFNPQIHRYFRELGYKTLHYDLLRYGYHISDQVEKTVSCDSKAVIISNCIINGESFYCSGLDLKKTGFGEISSIAVVCDESIFEGRLLSAESPIKKIFTTDIGTLKSTRDLDFDDDFSDIITIYKFEEINP
jgi:hypothetical protein